MSTLKVTIEKLTVLPHPNADKLELAQIGGYRAVVAKGQYKTGDYALYIPEQAVLPPELIEELGLIGKLAGPDKNRVKAVRLRRELSQGIVCRPKALCGDTELMKLLEEGGAPTLPDPDYAELLGITKWVPPIPVGMAGEVEAAPNLIRWPDIENAKRYPNMFEPGEEVVATEKVHGTCCLLTYQRSSDEVWVTSKGQGAKFLAILPSETNLYWRAVRRYRLAELAREMCEFFDAERIGIFGEVFGAGVQDLDYGAKSGQDSTLGYAMFDISIQKDGEARFLDAEVWDLGLTATMDAELRKTPTVPTLYRGPYDYEKLSALAEGRETVSGESRHVREGIVVRPATERLSPETGGRCIVKFVGEGYLMRGEGTEYE